MIVSQRLQIMSKVHLKHKLLSLFFCANTQLFSVECSQNAFSEYRVVPSVFLYYFLEKDNECISRQASP